MFIPIASPPSIAKFPVIVVYVFVVNVLLSTFKKKSLGFPPKSIA